MTDQRFIQATSQRMDNKEHMIKHALIFFTTLFMTFSSIAITAESHMLVSTTEQTLKQTYVKFKSLNTGKNADYIPELAKVNPHYFGIVIITVDGKMISIGDVDVPFAIESISKPFVYALALQDNGEAYITNKIGLNATGHRFNSVLAIEEKADHLQNPLVNAGAIQITSTIKGNTSAEKWQRVLTFIQQLSDGQPFLGKAVYQSEMATNQHNRAIAELLASYNMMYSDPLDAVDRYTKACSVMVTAKQLALMGATLANAGIHPLTHQHVIAPPYVRDTLAEMVVNGLYENSGAWWWKVGVPAKSGVGGGMLAVIPHKMAIAVFSPPLDEAGNSVRAQAVMEELSQRWKLHMLQ